MRPDAGSVENWPDGCATVDLPGASRIPKQGRLYRGEKWLSVGESKPAPGIAEDVFNLFISGGSPCLRKIRES